MSPPIHLCLFLASCFGDHKKTALPQNESGNNYQVYYNHDSTTSIWFTHGLINKVFHEENEEVKVVAVTNGGVQMSHLADSIQSSVTSCLILDHVKLLFYESNCERSVSSHNLQFITISGSDLTALGYVKFINHNSCSMKILGTNSIEGLYIASSEIFMETVTSEFIEAVTSVETLSITITNCSIKDVEKSALTKLFNLRAINFSNNKLESVKFLTKINSTSLWSIDLSNNDIEEIGRMSINQFPSLTHLHLNGNKLINLNFLEVKPNLLLMSISGNEGLKCSDFCWVQTTKFTSRQIPKLLSIAQCRDGSQIISLYSYNFYKCPVNGKISRCRATATYV